jgi:hypothetical protein
MIIGRMSNTAYGSEETSLICAHVLNMYRSCVDMSTPSRTWNLQQLQVGGCDILCSVKFREGPPSSRLHGQPETPVVVSDKDNKAVIDKLRWAKEQRAKGRPTIPSTIGVSPFHRDSAGQKTELRRALYWLFI